HQSWGGALELMEARGLRRGVETARGPVDAVRGVEFTVEPGEIVGFLGPNGAGKTTTMRMLTTLLTPTPGSAGGERRGGGGGRRGGRGGGAREKKSRSSSSRPGAPRPAWCPRARIPRA